MNALPVEPAVAGPARTALSKRGTPPVLGFLIGVVYGVLLTGFLFITGVLDVSASSYDARVMLLQAVPRVAKDMVPWLMIWWFVTPAVQRIPFLQPWLALCSSAALGAILVPRILGIGDLSFTQLGAMFLFGLVLTLPVVRAKDVWLPTAFFIGLHIVTVSVMGMPFGSLGQGVFTSRLIGDELITGGALGPVFGFAGILGQLWLAASLLRHQRLLFAAAPSRFQPRNEGLRQMAIGLTLAAAAATILFVLSIVTGQSRIGGIQITATAISNSLTTALPVAVSIVVLSCLALGTLAFALVGRGWVAAVIATAISVLLHLQVPGTNINSAVGFAALTLAATLAFANTGRLWMPIGILFGWLLFEGPVYGFPTNLYQLGRPWFEQTITAFPIFGGNLGPATAVFATAAKVLLVVSVILVTRTEKAESGA